MGYRILILDDNTEHITALTSACIEAGHEVVCQTSVSESMNWLNNKDHIDVIVSNTHLQTESVFEFLKAVREQEQHNWVQFVMMSSGQSDLAKFLDSTTRHAAKILGADKYVVMSEFSPQRLLKEIEASFPAQPPQKDQDAFRDALGLPRPEAELPKSINEAQEQ